MVTNLQHNFANNLEKKSYELQKASLFHEINHPSRKVQKNDFKKTPEERAKIWEMQQSYKKAMIKCYPDPKIRKQMNNPRMECE
jgi:hypothetical protein